MKEYYLIIITFVSYGNEETKQDEFLELRTWLYIFSVFCRLSQPAPRGQQVGSFILGGRKGVIRNVICTETADC